MSTPNLYLSRYIKNIRNFLFENFQFLDVKFSIYLKRHVIVMGAQHSYKIAYAQWEDANQLAHLHSLIRVD